MSAATDQLGYELACILADHVKPKFKAEEPYEFSIICAHATDPKMHVLITLEEIDEKSVERLIAAAQTLLSDPETEVGP